MPTPSAWRGHNDDSDLLDRAATHLERNGEYHHAASLYLRAGRIEQSGRPLRHLTLSSLSATVGLARDEWLDSLLASSASSTVDNPWVLVTRARILQQQAKYVQAVDLYEQAARSLSASGDKQGLLPVLMSTAFCLFNQGLWDESLDVLKRCRSLARSPHERVEVLVTEGTVLVSLCRWDEAVENWERALAIAPPEGRECSHPARLRAAKPAVRLSGPIRAGSTVGRKGPCRERRGQDAHSGQHAERSRDRRLSDGGLRSGEHAITECARVIASRGYAFLEATSLLTQADIALGRWDHRTAVVKIKQAQSLAGETGDAQVAFWAEVCWANSAGATAMLSGPSSIIASRCRSRKRTGWPCSSGSTRRRGGDRSRLSGPG